ncbi:E3 ubiquitin-protein ligase FANCL isoform X2 [Folsomia candida]|uniref:E3 ubiquitin-protein ligase FANCL isoform X2 n=1 Tax=Folsomia candida TaxID=158441 RepID=UPI0016053151|nr:E3 ubiquitin-protein ligase FANCL isoform X2 [Folsomia candida]
MEFSSESECKQFQFVICDHQFIYVWKMEGEIETEMEIDFQEDVAHRVPAARIKKVDNKSIRDHQILQIMEEFPLLTYWKDHTYWTGFIQGQRRLVRLAVSAPNFPRCDDASFQGDNDSMTIIANFQGMLTSKDGLLVDLLREIEIYINQHDPGDKNTESNSNGVQNVEFVSNNFREISMKYVDHLGRKHVVKCTIPPKYPHATVKVTVDLPPPSIAVHWPHSLSDILEQFKFEVDKYATFWSAMDELDSKCQLIDPIQPKRGDIHRRILMAQNIVINLIFNPLSPMALPEIKFSGPEKNILGLETLVDEHCKEWSEDKSILENLKDITQSEFLAIADEEGNENGSDDIESLCVICYSFEFEGNIPEVACDCGSMYHDKCLGDLLVNDCSVKAKRFCVDCPACGLELKVSKNHKATW